MVVHGRHASRGHAAEVVRRRAALHLVLLHHVPRVLVALRGRLRPREIALLLRVLRAYEEGGQRVKGWRACGVCMSVVETPGTSPHDLVTVDRRKDRARAKDGRGETR